MRVTKCKHAKRKHAACLLQHRQDVFLVQQQDVIALAALELVAGPVGEQDDVADLDLERLATAVLEEFARADGQDLALLRLLSGAVRQGLTSAPASPCRRLRPAARTDIR